MSHTVNDMLDKWKQEHFHELNPRTKVDYTRYFKVLRQRFGARDVRAFTRQEAVDYVNNGPSRGRTQRTKHIAVLRSTFTNALKAGWVEGNPCAHIEKSQPRKRAEFTLENFRKAVQLASASGRSGRVPLIFELALHTGRLQGDIIKLEWLQVDRSAGTITFRNAHIKDEDKKTEVVLITQEIEELLKRAERLSDSRKYVVPNQFGEKYTSAGFRTQFQRFLKERWKSTGNNLFTFHDIRKLSKKLAEARARAKTAEPADAFPQFSEALKLQAEGNAPFYRLLYCLEHLIRERIIQTMEKAAGRGWWDSDKIPQALRQEVASLVTREIDSAITQRSQRMIDYTTLGQLGQILRENWDLFEHQFTSKNAVSSVLVRLNLARGPIAHCCPISDLEMERLRLAVHDWFHTITADP